MNYLRYTFVMISFVLTLGCEQKSPEIRTHGISTDNAIKLLEKSSDAGEIETNIGKIRSNFAHDFEWPRFWQILKEKEFYETWGVENNERLHKLSNISCNSNEFTSFADFLLSKAKKATDTKSQTYFTSYITSHKRSCDALISNEKMEEIVTFLLDSRTQNKAQSSSGESTLVFSEELFNFIINEFDRRGSHYVWGKILSKVPEAFWHENQRASRQKGDDGYGLVAKSLYVQKQALGSVQGAAKEILTMYAEAAPLGMSLKKGGYLDYLASKGEVSWSQVWDTLAQDKKDNGDSANVSALLDLAKYSCLPEHINAFFRLANRWKKTPQAVMNMQLCKTHINQENFDETFSFFKSSAVDGNEVELVQFLTITYQADMLDGQKDRPWKDILMRVSDSLNLKIMANLRSESEGGVQPALTREYLNLYSDVFGGAQNIPFFEKDVVAIFNNSKDPAAIYGKFGYTKHLKSQPWARFFSKINMASRKGETVQHALQEVRKGEFLKTFSDFTCSQQSLENFSKAALSASKFDLILAKSKECSEPISKSLMKGIILRGQDNSADMQTAVEIFISEFEKARKDASGFATVIKGIKLINWTKILAAHHNARDVRSVKKLLAIFTDSLDADIPFVENAILSLSSKSKNLVGDIKKFGYKEYLPQLDLSELAQSLKTRKVDAKQIQSLMAGLECTNQKIYTTLIDLAFASDDMKYMALLSKECRTLSLPQKRLKVLADRIAKMDLKDVSFSDHLRMLFREHEKSSSRDSKMWQELGGINGERWAAIVDHLENTNQDLLVHAVFNFHEIAFGSMPFMTDAFLNLVHKVSAQRKSGKGIFSKSNLAQLVARFGYQEKYISHLEWEKFYLSIDSDQLDSDTRDRLEKIQGDQRCSSPRVYESIVDTALSSQPVPYAKILQNSKSCLRFPMVFDQTKKLATSLQLNTADASFSVEDLQTYIAIMDMELQKKPVTEKTALEWKEIISLISDDEWQAMVMALSGIKDRVNTRKVFSIHAKVFGKVGFLTTNLLALVETSVDFEEDFKKYFYVENAKSIEWSDFWSQMAEHYPDYPTETGFGNTFSIVLEGLRKFINQVFRTFGLGEFDWAKRSSLNRKTANQVLGLIKHSCTVEIEDGVFDSFVSLALQWKQASAITEGMKICNRIPSDENMVKLLTLVINPDTYNKEVFADIFNSDLNVLDRMSREQLAGIFSKISNQQWLALFSHLRSTEGHAIIRGIYKTFIKKSISIDFLEEDIFHLILNSENADGELKSGYYFQVYPQVNWDRLWGLFLTQFAEKPSEEELSANSTDVVLDFYNQGDACSSPHIHTYFNLAAAWNASDKWSLAMDYCNINWSGEQLQKIIDMNGRKLTPQLREFIAKLAQDKKLLKQNNLTTQDLQKAFASISSQEWMAYFMDLKDKEHRSANLLNQMIDLHYLVYGGLRFYFDLLFAGIFNPDENLDFTKWLNEQELTFITGNIGSKHKVRSLVDYQDWKHFWVKLAERSDEVTKLSSERIIQLICRAPESDKFNDFARVLLDKNKLLDLPDVQNVSRVRCSDLVFNAETLGMLVDKLQSEMKVEKPTFYLDSIISNLHYVGDNKKQIDFLKKIGTDVIYKAILKMYDNEHLSNLGYVYISLARHAYSSEEIERLKCELIDSGKEEESTTTRFTETLESRGLVSMGLQLAAMDFRYCENGIDGLAGVEQQSADTSSEIFASVLEKRLEMLSELFAYTMSSLSNSQDKISAEQVGVVIGGGLRSYDQMKKAIFMWKDGYTKIRFKASHLISGDIEVTEGFFRTRPSLANIVFSPLGEKSFVDLVAATKDSFDSEELVRVVQVISAVSGDEKELESSNQKELREIIWRLR